MNKYGLRLLGLGAGGLGPHKGAAAAPRGPSTPSPQLASPTAPASPSSAGDTLLLLHYQQRTAAEQRCLTNTLWGPPPQYRAHTLYPVLLKN